MVCKIRGSCVAQKRSARRMAGTPFLRANYTNGLTVIETWALNPEPSFAMT